MKILQISHCLPLSTSNIVWVSSDTINRALRHNCGTSTTIHVTQTADQITSPHKPNRNHNHNVQAPTQTAIPEVHFRVTLPTAWNQLAEFWRLLMQRWVLGPHRKTRKSANTCLLMPSVIFALVLFLYLTYNSFFLVKQEHSNALNSFLLLKILNWASSVEHNNT